MNDIFMIDIETTGVDKEKDDIIEIGIVHAKRMEFGLFFVPKRVYHRTLPTDKEPSEWAKGYPGQVTIFKQCQEKFLRGERNDATSMRFLREELQAFFERSGVKSPMLSGLNIVGFDIAFLKRDGILKDGDHNYRSWCLTPLIETICHVNGVDSQASKEREKVTEHLEKATPFDLYVPGSEGGEHTAIYDCQKELRVLNSIIAMANAIPKLSLG